MIEFGDQVSHDNRYLIKLETNLEYNGISC